jgi:hypothetical protein
MSVLRFNQKAVLINIHQAGAGPPVLNVGVRKQKQKRVVSKDSLAKQIFRLLSRVHKLGTQNLRRQFKAVLFLQHTLRQ